MRLAFCLYRYFPHSGLARDMLRITREALDRGHEVDLYCREWQGARPEGATVTVLHSSALSNHGRATGFIRRLSKHLGKESYDAVVGFNKMPGLDFYYAADACFVARARQRHGRAYELSPRYRSWRRLESAVFGTWSRTKIFLLSEQSLLGYRAFYATADERIRLIPSTLDVAHRLDALSPDRRKGVRDSLGIGDAEIVVLMVGSGFFTKGVDRVLEAFAALPAALRQRSRLVVVGRDNLDSYGSRASRLGLRDRVIFAGGRDDVPELMRSAELLVHPARNENTGSVLLEALAAGLPVLTTANCGYAHHVLKAGAGVVLDGPFRQQALDAALEDLLNERNARRRKTMAANGRLYGQDASLYRMPQKVVDSIENWREDIPAPAFAGYVHPELSGLSRRLRRLEDWLDIKGEVYRRTADRTTLRFEHEGRAYFLKAHFGIGAREVLKNLLQFKWPVFGAENEWLAIHFLKSIGIPAPTAVGYGRGPGWAHRKSFIVTRELTGMTSLEHETERKKRRNTAEIRWRRRLIQRTADIARVLHDNGINHRDFYLCHFMFDRSEKAKDEITLHLIDLHRAQVRSHTPRRWRVKDIASLYYSALPASLDRNERLRFIRTYTDTGSLRLALQDRSFWAQVERKAEKLKRTELERGYADAAGVANHIN